MNWYRLHKDEVLQELNTGFKGLNDADVQTRQQEYGPNELQAAKQRSRLTIFISQFKDVMILILAAAAVVSFVAGETTDAIVILTIILVNAVIGSKVYLNGGENLDTVLNRVNTAGGKVVLPKTPIGDGSMGYIGIFEDTEGNHVSLHSMQ